MSFGKSAHRNSERIHTTTTEETPGGTVFLSKKFWNIFLAKIRGNFWRNFGKNFQNKTRELTMKFHRVDRMFLRMNFWGNFGRTLQLHMSILLDMYKNQYWKKKTCGFVGLITCNIFHDLKPTQLAHLFCKSLCKTYLTVFIRIRVTQTFPEHLWALGHGLLYNFAEDLNFLGRHNNEI